MQKILTRKALKTRKLILDVAIRLSVKYGYLNVTRKQIKKASKVSEGLIPYYFGTMIQLRKEILKEAIAQENLVIIGQAVLCSDSSIKNISGTLKKKALEKLLNK